MLETRTIHPTIDPVIEHETARRRRIASAETIPPPMRRPRGQLEELRDQVLVLEMQMSSTHRQFLAATDKATRKALIVQRERLRNQLIAARREMGSAIRSRLDEVSR